MIPIIKGMCIAIFVLALNPELDITMIRWWAAFISLGVVVNFK